MPPAYFFARWITHFCAPVFVFLAGSSAFLSLARGSRTVQQISRFLVTRGLWLFADRVDGDRLRLLLQPRLRQQLRLVVQVIWVLGASMIVLAGLVRLPMWVSVAMGVTMVAGHDLLDGVSPATFGAWARLWNVLHVPGPVMVGPVKLFVLYPLIPWVGVMALGYAFGALISRSVTRPAAERQRLLLSIGLALSVAFVVVRALNGYGEPKPWTRARRNAGDDRVVPRRDEVSAVAGLPVDDARAVDRAARVDGAMERWVGECARDVRPRAVLLYIVHIYVIHMRDGRRRLAPGLSGVRVFRVLSVPAEGVRLLASGDVSAVGGARAADVSVMPMVRLGEGESSASAAVVFVG